MVRRAAREISLNEGLRPAQGIVAGVFYSLIFWALCIGVAYAGDKKPPPKSMLQQQQEQYQKQQQAQKQKQYQDQTTELTTGDVTTEVSTGAVTVETAAAGGSADNEGNSLSVESHYESGPADLVLVPNNNTERCLRVFGFAFGNTDGSGMLGIPWRSKNCDYKGFASDADAQGNTELGWFWRCHMKSAYRVFRGKNESAESAIGDCHTQMVDSVAMVRTISTLREQLTTINDVRELDREQYKESMELQRQLCDESNARVHEACVTK